MEEVIKEELDTQQTGRCQIHEGFFWLYLSITIAFKCILYSTINCFVKYLNPFDDFSTFLNTLKAKDGLGHLH